VIYNKLISCLIKQRRGCENRAVEFCIIVLPLWSVNLPRAVAILFACYLVPFDCWSCTALALVPICLAVNTFLFSDTFDQSTLADGRSSSSR